MRRLLQSTAGEAAVITVLRARMPSTTTEHTPVSCAATFAEGLSWQANLNDNKLTAPAGTGQIESAATEPARAAGEQEAWDWVS